MQYKGMLKEDALKSKTVLITGGGTGLGKSMGKYFMDLASSTYLLGFMSSASFPSASTG